MEQKQCKSWYWTDNYLGEEENQPLTDGSPSSLYIKSLYSHASCLNQAPTDCHSRCLALHNLSLFASLVSWQKLCQTQISCVRCSCLTVIHNHTGLQALLPLPLARCVLEKHQTHWAKQSYIVFNKNKSAIMFASGSDAPLPEFHWNAIVDKNEWL